MPVGLRQRIVRFVVVAGGGSLVLWSTFGSRLPGAIVGGLAQQLLSSIFTQPIELQLRARELRLSLVVRQDLVVTAVGDLFDFVRNLPLFLGIVIALADRRSGRLWLVLIAGSAAVLTIDALIVAARAGDRFCRGLEVPQPFAIQLLGIFGWSQPTGGAGFFMLPALVGAFIALLGLRDEPVGAQRVATAQRHGGR